MGVGQEFSPVEEGPFSVADELEFDHDEHQWNHAIEMQERFRSDLARIVKGQEHVKDIACVSMYQIHSQAYSDQKIENGNTHLMFIGDSGTGKTLTAEHMAHCSGVPFAEFNMASTTPSGYVGRSFSDAFDAYVKNVARFHLPTLTKSAATARSKERMSIEHTEIDGDAKPKGENPSALDAFNSCKQKPYGIIYLDEIDKLVSAKNEQVARFREAVQDEMLRALQGETITTRLWNTEEVDGVLAGSWSLVDISTKDLTFIVSGAFDGLSEIIAKRLGRSQATPIDELYAEMSTDDLIDYGFKPEFIGRFALKIGFNRLNKDVLVDILENSPRSPLKRELNTLKIRYGVEAAHEQDIVPYLAELALGYPKEGARKLDGLCKELFLPMYSRVHEIVDPMHVITMDYTKRTLGYHQDRKAIPRGMGFR